ncbi:hypothetical protein CYMTET_10611 [Cymbomonas tetramitiformis]|uniref:Uncharacterized protein n=1 Tax=Cymbomonas tetramitiformis TaxID=36881 RepID=A0AAE0GPE2_9CHLO|nr:hypothetical protein CYMTET_10611 [Cymbomonas tetramitiformis]
MCKECPQQLRANVPLSIPWFVVPGKIDRCIVVEEVNLVFNEKDFYEDQEFRHSPSKFLGTGAAAPRNANTISVETSQSALGGNIPKC